MKQSFIEDFQTWKKELSDANVRGLLFISGSNSFVSSTKKQICASTKSIKEINTTAPMQQKPISQILGSEFNNIYFDARKSFDTNLFAACCGTLIGGGCLFLCLPSELENYFNQSINTYSNEQNHSRVQRNLSATLANYPLSPILKRLLISSSNAGCTAFVTQNNHIFNKLLIQPSLPQEKNTHTQLSVINSIISVATGHSKRPLVISASRGRGKSAALGIAASRLLSSKAISIVITAPNLSNLTSFYKHVKQTLSLEKGARFNKSNLLLPNGSKLRFIPIDIIIKEQPKANLLLIDEAAAIPVTLLEQLTLRYNRLVFSTTTHGYEGNGKGFNVRFKHKLLDKRPQTKFVQLYQPIRWSQEDRLEALCFDALLLETKLHTIPNKFHCDPKKTIFSVSEAAELLTNEVKLKQIFALLIHAHYQTRPADLEQILSNSNLIVCSLTQDKLVVAVALINKEGALSQTQCNEIYLGKKRLKGDLLPQSMILHHGQENAGLFSYYRIMRIAVHPEQQNNGIGSLLLNEITRLAQLNSIEILGASFAADEQVVNFWLKNQFSIIRFGGAKDSSSGLYSCECITALSSQAKQLKQLILARFNESFNYKLHRELSELSNEIIKYLFFYQIAPTQPLSKNDISELKQFSNGKRGFNTVDWLVERLIKIYLYYKNNSSSQPNNDITFLIDFVIKQIPEKQAAEHYPVTGKKQVIEMLRKLTATLMNELQFI